VDNDWTFRFRRPVFQRRDRAPAYNRGLAQDCSLCYSRKGITTAATLRRCCEENVMFMALSPIPSRIYDDCTFHFIDAHRDNPVFRDILLYARRRPDKPQISRIDGCKMSSNCAKDGAAQGGFEKRRKDRVPGSFLLRKHRECDPGTWRGHTQKKGSDQPSRSKVRKIDRGCGRTMITRSSGQAREQYSGQRNARCSSHD